MRPATMRPGGEAIRRNMESEVTLLPQPDSPTMASVSPGATEKETPSTARTTPSRVKKWVFSPSISSKGEALCMRSHIAGKTRIERIAQAVAQQIDRQYRDREERAGKEDEIIGDLKQGARLRHDVAPARNVGRRAGAKKRQDSLGEHGGGADVGALHKQR